MMKKYERFVKDFELNEQDAELMVKYKKIAEYFEEASENIKNKKITANYILGPIFRKLATDSEKEEFNISVPAKSLNELVVLAENKKINSNIARNVLEQMLDTGKAVWDFISESDIEGIAEEELREICKKAVEANKTAIEQYLNGKEKALGAVMGYIMKETKGRADAAAAAEMIKQLVR